jgi:hypothetical protein
VHGALHGPSDPAIVAVDLKAGRVRRAHLGHHSLHPEEDVSLEIEDARGRAHNGPAAPRRASAGQTDEVPFTPRPRDWRVGTPGIDPAIQAVESLVSVGKVRLFGLVVARGFGRYGLLARWCGLDYSGQDKPRSKVRGAWADLG